MLKRVSVLVGTLLFSSAALLGLMWLMSSSSSIVHAEPAQVPAGATANAALQRPHGNATSAGCITITQDITANTIWTGTCYLVACRLWITNNVTLTIQPPVSGTRIWFQKDTQLQVLGRLRAQGASTQPITFTSAISHPHPADWQGIFIDKDSQGTHIQHSLIEYARVGIDIEDTNGVTITSNTFRYNGDGGNRDGAIGGDTDNSLIANNHIFSCSNGIALHESSGNKILNNTIHDIEHYGLIMMQETTSGGS